MMKTEPVEEWRRLTQHYREMSDGELYELESDFADLTETAQQVLRDEMRARKLEVPRKAQPEVSAALPEARRWKLVQEAPEIEEDAEEAAEDDGQPREFTWKTVLCECNEATEAWQLYKALERSGIESWVEGPGSPVGHNLTYPRVLVAADQLEQAREIAARPIPQEIIDESNEPDEEYKPPVCPQCGAEDPTLESTDPVNHWLCESCGKQWSDPLPSEAS
jgi:hypothetical protein